MPIRFSTFALLTIVSLALANPAFAQLDKVDLDPISTLATSDRTTGTYAEIVEAARLEAREGDLKDIIVSAFEFHPQLKSLRAQGRATRENVLEARASYLPQIALDSTASISNREARLQDGSGFDQNTEPLSVSLRLNQTLYNGGRRSLATRNALISTQVANARYRISATSISAEIINDYTALMASEAEADALDRSVVALINLEKSVQARRAAGDATRTEVSQAVSRLAAARARREAARASVSNARARLLSKTGFLVQNPKLPKEALEPLTLSLQDILERAKQESASLENTKLNEQTAQVSLQQETRKWLPTVSLTANATSVRDSSPTIARDDDLNVGLRLTMPLYTGGAGSAQTRRAAAQYQAARYASDDALREVRLQVTQLWTQLQSGRASLEAQHASVAASEDALIGVTRAQLAGLSTTQDILDATQVKLEAEIALAQAEFSQYATRLLLRLFIGELDVYGFDL